MAPRSDAAQEEALAVAFVAVGWEHGEQAPIPLRRRVSSIHEHSARGHVFPASLATLASLPPFLPPLPAHAALKVSAG